jgi:hypothetical protein
MSSRRAMASTTAAAKAGDTDAGIRTQVLPAGPSKIRDAESHLSTSASSVESRRLQSGRRRPQWLERQRPRKAGADSTVYWRRKGGLRTAEKPGPRNYLRVECRIVGRFYDRLPPAQSLVRTRSAGRRGICSSRSAGASRHSIEKMQRRSCHSSPPAP